jgi:hypothetical protein
VSAKPSPRTTNGTALKHPAQLTREVLNPKRFVPLS